MCTVHSSNNISTSVALVSCPDVTPETFDGEGDWQECLAYFMQCAEVNGWQDPERAQFLGVRLRDAACRFFTTLPAARRVNWQHLCADMGNRFAPAAVQTSTRPNSVCGNGRPVRTYCESLMTFAA